MGNLFSADENNWADMMYEEEDDLPMLLSKRKKLKVEKQEAHNFELFTAENRVLTEAEQNRYLKTKKTFNSKALHDQTRIKIDDILNENGLLQEQVRIGDQKEVEMAQEIQNLCHALNESKK